MPKKILLAEDSLTIQKVFELTFAKSDFILTIVDNGTDAVRLAAEISPALVVADITLPGRNGFEVAGDLAAGANTRNIPVLILSGSLGPFDEESFKSCGAGGVMFKPFESQELIDKVNEMLSAAETEHAAGKGEGPAPGTEDWDFSDVLEEVDDFKSKSSAPPSASSSAAAGTLSLGEYDVSVDEIGAVETAAAPVVEVAAPQLADLPEMADVFSEPPFSPGDACEEPSAGITDISPALADVEELEEIEDLEEMELLHKESEGPLELEELPLTETAGAPLPGPALAEEAEPEIDLDALLGGVDEASTAIPDLEPAYAAQPEPEPEPTPQPEEDLEAMVVDMPAVLVPPAAGLSAADVEVIAIDALREQFSARAREIVEKVATEAVEKVMWEWMDRLSSEFTERIRESVESVAWDVIPRTAEALIREEIARIREKDGKRGESR